MEWNLKEYKEVSVWAKAQLQIEVERIKSCGSRCLPLCVKNTSIVREDGRIVNRVEVDTNFNFERVKQIFVGDSIPCPLKSNFFYVNVFFFIILILHQFHLINRFRPKRLCAFLTNHCQ